MSMMSGPSPMPQPAVRRTPRQERSNDTVNQILDATSRLLGRTPLDEITTSRIATEAGVSVGALYRFFPDKQVILDTIAVRHVENFQSILLRTVALSALSDGPAFLNRVIDAYISFLDENPDFRALALGRHVSAVARQTQAVPNAGPAALVRWFMMWRLGIHDAEALDLRLRVAIETGERLIAFAYEQPDSDQRRLVLDEMKRLLAAYLFEP